jgi:arsenate reductase (thioredoxin)
MSAGLEPGILNPLVVEVMKEIGVDISHNQVKSAFDLFKKGELFSYAVSVCDAASAETCPLFPGLLTAQIHWSFADPSSFVGTLEEKLVQTRAVRDAIKAKIEAWLKEVAALNILHRQQTQWDLQATPQGVFYCSFLPLRFST